MKTALITGASSGIGKELAYIFAKEGYNLILVARSEDTLLEIANDCAKKHSIKADVISHDLSTPSSGIELAKKVTAKGWQVDVLVNNAGYGDFGNFVDSDIKRGIKMLNLNMVNLTELTLIYAKEMVARNSGKILNVASSAAFQPIPKFAIYAATKAYVLNLTEAIHFELKGTNVGITALCPGATKTGFEDAAEMEESKLFDKFVMDAETVAKVGYKGLMKNKMYVIPGTRNKILAFIANATPFRGLKVWVASKVT
ncbi:MAG: SDR family oxidoreductase [Fluviicola sp.]|nr:SDR family oxidoreductase [Fluviicola sp.]